MIELLLSLILALTGIARDVDPELTAIAQRRAVEASSDFSHNGAVSWTAEVLAWNQQFGVEPATRRAAQQWRESPGHWAILTDASLTRIGCGHHYNGEKHTFACVLSRGSVTQPAPTPAPTPAPAPSTTSTPTPTTSSMPAPTHSNVATTPTPVPVVMPDTAMQP